MLEEFIDFVTALFPSISPYVQDRAKEAIEQFEFSGRQVNLLSDRAYDYLAQGDIFDGIPFVRVKNDGDICTKKGKGMLISNTCSADHDEDIVIAPLLEMDELDLNIGIVKNNKYYRLFYLPDAQYEKYVVDFSLLNTFNKNVLNSMLDSQKVIKEASLNQLGFYMLICKLTVCFLRPEDEGVQDSRYRNFMNIMSETN